MAGQLAPGDEVYDEIVIDQESQVLLFPFHSSLHPVVHFTSPIPSAITCPAHLHSSPPFLFTFLSTLYPPPTSALLPTNSPFIGGTDVPDYLRRQEAQAHLSGSLLNHALSVSPFTSHLFEFLPIIDLISSFPYIQKFAREVVVPRQLNPPKEREKADGNKRLTPPPNIKRRL